MPSWNELLAELESQGSDEAISHWIDAQLTSALTDVARIRGDRHVILYGSAFLQKPQTPAMNIQITAEDLNGLMSVIYGMDWSKGLTLILHTPGGVINAAESLVDYLRSKFPDIEVVVPAFAMSAGTMIALSANRIVMGRQSQLGPIDPQMGGGGRSVSAQAIVDQFEKGKAEILSNPILAHAWAPAMQSLGPALLVEAQNALDYGESMVAKWLERHMFADRPDAKDKAEEVARHFSDAGTHKSHGRRINLAEVRSQDLWVESLEDSQPLQEAVLTAYHLMTLIFEKSPAVKIMASDTAKVWLKNWGDLQYVAAAQQPSQAAPAMPVPVRPSPTPEVPSGAPPGAAPAMNREQRRAQEREGRKKR